MSLRKRSSEEVTINLTPMIDVVFLLVIFFMVGSKFNNGDSRVDVSVKSTAQTRAITRVPDERIVNVYSNGEVTLDGTVVSRAQLVDQLTRLHQSYPALTVAVRGAGAVPFSSVLEVAQEVKRSGATALSIAEIADPNARIRR